MKNAVKDAKLRELRERQNAHIDQGIDWWHNAPDGDRVRVTNALLHLSSCPEATFQIIARLAHIGMARVILEAEEK